LVGAVLFSMVPAQARDHAHVGVNIGIGVGSGFGGHYGGGFRGGYYSGGGYYRNSCYPYRLSHGFYSPSVVYYSSPDYVYVEPPVQRVIVQTVPETVVVPASSSAVSESVPPPAPAVATGSPPPYGGRIGNSDEVKSPYSTFQLKTQAARNTVVFDAFTGQAFRVP
jgi:hypothetical protein